MTAAPDLRPAPRRLVLVVYGTAAPAGSKRAFQHKTTGRVVTTDDSKRSRPWKTDVSQAAGAAMAEVGPLLEGALRAVFRFLVVRPKGHFRKNGALRSSAPPYPAKRPDVLKLARAVEDALAGVVYRDDAQIVDERLEKLYGEPARVEIVVEELTP